MVSRCVWGSWGVSVVILAGGVLMAAASARAQSAGMSGGAQRPAPAGAGGTTADLVPVPPADGGTTGGGGKGGAGGGGSGGAPPATMGCNAFMACVMPQQGHGAMIGFDISLADEVADQPVDQLRITMTLAGKPVSWSPLLLPEAGAGLMLPLTTSMFQTCADNYGEATSTVEALVKGKVVASAAGTLTAEDCVAFIVNVVLQPVPGEPIAGMTGSVGDPGSAGAAMAGNPGGAAVGASAGGASAAGQGGAAGTRSGTTPEMAGASAPDGHDTAGCGCEVVGAVPARHAGTWLAAVAACALVRVRRRRRASGHTHPSP